MAGLQKRAHFDTAAPYVAAFVIVKKDNMIAFVLRKNCGWMNGYYGLPSGKVERNEPSSVGALREAKEEIGIDVDEADLRYLHTVHRRSEDSDWLDIYFEAMQWRGEVINAEPHMHSELAWLDPRNLPNNVIPAVACAIAEIEAGNLYSEYGWDNQAK